MFFGWLQVFFSDRLRDTKFRKVFYTQIINKKLKLTFTLSVIQSINGLFVWISNKIKCQKMTSILNY